MVNEIADCAVCVNSRYAVAPAAAGARATEQYPLRACMQPCVCGGAGSACTPVQGVSCTCSTPAAAGSSNNSSDRRCPGRNGRGSDGGSSHTDCERIMTAHDFGLHCNQNSRQQVSTAGTAAGASCGTESEASEDYAGSSSSTTESVNWQDNNLAEDQSSTAGCRRSLTGGTVGAEAVSNMLAGANHSSIGKGSSSGSRNSKSSPVANSAIAAVDDSPTGLTGHCCSRHEALLLQLLARLNWHLLDPSALEQLEAQALLGPAALLEIYR
eukprot:GHRR01018183.1.p1 GENE.GHRR01018183.1~~GHRR01018183.1.p1  ORF type:complete len:269 (+),score=107.22 GHRR01018183.1:1537-2343(+)